MLPYLYIGTEQNAKNVSLLENLKITHVINTTDGYIGGNPARLKLYDNHYKYLNFLAQDRRFYYILQHFEEVYRFIEDARINDGKVLIHCSLGINRSGALSAAYIMQRKLQGPLTTVSAIKRLRGCTLTNPGFQEQIIHFANRRGLLARDKHFIENRSTEQQLESQKARVALEKKVQTKDRLIQEIFRDITT